jgi:hypothetical protein
MKVDRENFIITEAMSRYRDSKYAASAFIDGAKFADNFPDWRRPEKELPQDGILVLALDKSNRVHVVRYYRDSQAWVDQMDYEHEYCGIKLWMPMPKFPVPAVQDESEE